MSLLHFNLNAKDQALVRTTAAFLESRLEKKETIEWALDLRSGDTVKRWAILSLLNQQGGITLREPWRSAWRIIEESWNSPSFKYDVRRHEYIVENRLSSGERSSSLVSAIVDLVAPGIALEPYETWKRQVYKIPNRARTFRHLFRAEIKCGKTIDPMSLGLENLTDKGFIISLANALDAAVVRGLDIARSIGLTREYLYLHRVYFLSRSERGEEMDEPDAVNEGIAPSVKLLHAVVLRLVDIDYTAALGFLHRWNRKDSPIHLRLWAAMSRDPRITSAVEAGEFLRGVNYKVFWDVHHHPEITELRALRFSEFDEATRNAVTRRIRRGPSRNLWPPDVEPGRFEEYRDYWIARELKRLEIAGATLSSPDKTWLESNIGRFTDLVQMNRLDEGFLGLQEGEILQPTPDRSMDSRKGIDRLRALEKALSSSRRGWNDAPADRARDWLREKGNAVKVLKDMESSPGDGAEFPKVWECLGWAHSPTENQLGETIESDLHSQASRVLRLLEKLPNGTLSEAIEGISNWFCCWKEYLVRVPDWSTTWYRTWRLAVETTNEMQPPNEEPDLDILVRSNSDEPDDIDTLNTSAGRLLGLFFAARPDPTTSSPSFEKMRNEVVNACGRSGLIAKYRMIWHLEYFLKADEEWTENYLIEPLRADDGEALALWRSIARRTRFKETLEIIGNEMVERTADGRLGRKTRRSLAFSLVVESLHALRERREPAVPYDQIQQMIRFLEAEVRTYCAETITRFVNDLSEPSDQEPDPPSREDLFLSAAKPFLVQVWPQERFLASPGVSAGLSRLPAAARGRFAEAVNTVERFLVPFDCWSMGEYGLYGNDDEETPRLSIIDDGDKAKALLRLLDHTVGTAENAIVPYYLGDALDQVRRIAPNLARTLEYRRLETAARRGG